MPMSAVEQEMLELINRMRVNPSQELGLLFDSLAPLHSSDPDVQRNISYFAVDGALLAEQWATLAAVPPLAWSPELSTAAEAHNDGMIAADSQSHQLPDEGDLSARIVAAGYIAWSSLAENVFCYGTSVFHAHAGFAIDWGTGATGIQDPPGHRNNIMNASYNEVGIAITEETDAATGVGPLVITQDFGNRTVGNPYLLGVVFSDLDQDGNYDAGEGRQNAYVRVGTQASLTWESGGYQRQAAPGTWSVEFGGGGMPNPVLCVVSTRGSNTKLDLLNNNWLRSTVTTTLGKKARHLTLLGDQAINGTGNAASNRLVGGDGANLLEGLGRADTLIGGQGNDTLVGGRGADRFRFEVADQGLDVISDFTPGTDRIEVKSANFGSLPLGPLGRANFRKNAPVDGNDYFLFDTTTRVLSYDPDGIGPLAATALASVASLTATDIVVVA